MCSEIDLRQAPGQPVTNQDSGHQRVCDGDVDDISVVVMVVWVCIDFGTVLSSRLNKVPANYMHELTMYCTLHN